MRHLYKNTALSRNKTKDKGLLRTLVHAIIVHGKIVTTKKRGKVLQAHLDRMITIAKRATSAGERRLNQIVGSIKMVDQVKKTILPLLTDRTSGYTRRVLLNKRLGDGTEMVNVEWVNRPESKEKKE